MPNHKLYNDRNLLLQILSLKGIVNSCHVFSRLLNHLLL